MDVMEYKGLRGFYATAFSSAMSQWYYPLYDVVLLFAQSITFAPYTLTYGVLTRVALLTLVVIIILRKCALRCIKNRIQPQVMYSIVEMDQRLVQFF